MDTSHTLFDMNPSETPLPSDKILISRFRELDRDSVVLPLIHFIEEATPLRLLNSRNFRGFPFFSHEDRHNSDHTDDYFKHGFSSRLLLAFLNYYDRVRDVELSPQLVPHSEEEKENNYRRLIGEYYVPPSPIPTSVGEIVGILSHFILSTESVLLRFADSSLSINPFDSLRFLYIFTSNLKTTRISGYDLIDDTYEEINGRLVRKSCRSDHSGILVDICVLLTMVEQQVELFDGLYAGLHASTPDDIRAFEDVKNKIKLDHDNRVLDCYIFSMSAG